jgi:1-aminocyclopropane-1-carboxylate deaminase
MLSYSMTPITRLKHPISEAAGVKLLIKREDLNHPEICGNKWWKLKYNLGEAERQGCDTLLTFGGAYSNHIYATAAAASETGLKSVGIIRGEDKSLQNPTLTFAAAKGMQLDFISREDYRLKDSESFRSLLKDKYPTAFIIPEGGTNEFALKGVREFTDEYLNTTAFDYLILPVGTGGTIAGIIQKINPAKIILGVSVLKNGDFLRNDIGNLIGSRSSSLAQWEIFTEYHYGGYGKVTKPLMELIFEMTDRYNLPLDPIYTGKAMGAMLSKIREGYFPTGSTILFLHTGGLQGSKKFVTKFKGSSE